MVIHADRWEVVRDILSQPGLLREIVDSYFNHARDQMAVLRQAQAAEDVEAVRQAAHSIAGGGGNLGATRVYELSMRIEDMATSSKLPTRHDVDELEAELERAEDAVRRLMQEAGS